MVVEEILVERVWRHDSDLTIELMRPECCKSNLSFSVKVQSIKFPAPLESISAETHLVWQHKIQVR